MAQPEIRDDTSPAPVAENEPTSDIIFILDKMELLLQAITKIKQNGRCRAIQAERQNRSSFLQVDKHSNLLELSEELLEPGQRPDPLGHSLHAGQRPRQAGEQADIRRPRRRKTNPCRGGVSQNA